MDRGALQATVHGVTKSWTQLKQLSTHAHIDTYGYLCIGTHMHTHTHTHTRRERVSFLGELGHVIVAGTGKFKIHKQASRLKASGSIPML